MPEVNVDPNEENQNEDIEEHNEKMRQKAQEGTKINTNDNDGSDNSDGENSNLLAGKYESEEDLQKGILEAVKGVTGAEDLEDAYKELETQLHSSSDNDEDDNAEDSSDNSDLKIDNTEDDDSSDNSEDSNDDNTNNEELDFSKYEQEFAENGELSEESIQELEEAGYDRSFINRYLKGLEVEVQEFEQEIYGITGDKETYEQMIRWAGENLPEEEIEFFNETLESGSINRTKMLVESLYSRYQNADNKPNLVRGNKSNNNISSQDRYESRQELMEDMASEKYENDPAFRKKVEQKLARSNIL